MAQSRLARGIPDRRSQAWPCASTQPQDRDDLRTEAGLGAVPLVSAGSAGCEILPGEDGPLGSLACRVRSYTRAHPRPGIGKVAGVDRGVAVSAAVSTGEVLHCPHLSPG